MPRKTKEQQIKELNEKIKQLTENNISLAESNLHMRKEAERIRKTESAQTIGAKIAGLIVAGLGFYLPIAHSEIFSWMMLFWDGEKVKTHIPVYSFLGIIVIFWPQVKMIANYLLNLYKAYRGKK